MLCAFDIELVYIPKTNCKAKFNEDIELYGIHY